MKRHSLSQDSLIQVCSAIRSLNDLLKQKPANESRTQWAMQCGMSELELNRAIKAGRKAEGTLFQTYRGLIIHIAKPYLHQAEMNDLIQEGFLGLRTAATRYDPQRGCEFSTYAFWWILNAIKVALDNNSGEEDPIYNASLDGMSIWESEIIEAQASKPDPQTRAIASSEFSELREHLNFLSEYEQQLIRQRYGLDGMPLTLKEIGLRYNISYETVRRHLNHAIAKLRSVYALEKCA